MHGEMRSAYKIVVGKPEEKRKLRRPRRRWEDNIRMDIGEIGWDGMEQIHLSQDRNQWRALLNTVIYLRVPKFVGKFVSSGASGRNTSHNY
jgi:hypothetical protein